jgi:ketosteroid isomerase-like protein
MRIPRPLAFLAILVCLTRPALAADVAAPADRAAIEQVVQQFQSAIIAKDGKALGALFLPDYNSWLAVADGSTFAAAKARNPAARKVMPSTWKEFADFVANSEKPVEERFSNVRIESNGAVASVYFDFEFMIDGGVTNRGSESWQMVRAEDGWKISSMLYSIGR